MATFISALDEKKILPVLAELVLMAPNPAIALVIFMVLSSSKVKFSPAVMLKFATSKSPEPLIFKDFSTSRVVIFKFELCNRQRK